MRQEYNVNITQGKGRSLNANAAENLNCYVEQTSDGRQTIVGRPGHSLKFVLPNAPVRGCYSDTGTSYWVAGNGVYKVLPDFTVQHLGNIGTYNGKVKFASSGIDLMIVDGVSGWSISISSSVLTQITDPDFPNNPVSVVFINNYFVVTVKGLQQFFVSQELNIATAWNGLDFATAEGNPDAIMAAEILSGELVLMGYKTTELWSFTGNSDFPFQRNSNVVIDQGCIAANSPGKALDSIYWLGGDDIGQGIVWRLNGYQPERVSTHEIEQKIASMPYIEDAFSVVYQIEGHVFYILQFPSGNTTLAYDTVTGLWHTLSYRDPITGESDIWRVSCHCFSGSRHLVGDTQNGNVYDIRTDVYTDNGAPIIMQVTGTANKFEQKELFYTEFIIDMETGVGINANEPPLIGLQWSNDGGHTYGNWRYTSIGSIGQYGARAYFSMLGKGRNRVWRIRITEPVKRVLLGTVINAQAGIS